MLSDLRETRDRSHSMDEAGVSGATRFFNSVSRAPLVEALQRIIGVAREPLVHTGTFQFHTTVLVLVLTFNALIIRLPNP